MKLKRPLDVYSLLEDGDYKGTTGIPTIKEIPSKYHPDGIREVVCLPVVVESDGGEIELNYICTATWSPKGNLIKLLKSLRMLPEVGENLDLDAMANISVIATIETVVRENVTFVNITNVRRKKKNIKSKMVRNDN